MRKNIIIIVLLIISFGSLIYAQYQRTLYKRALHESQVVLDQEKMKTEEARKLAQQAMQDAQKQRELAEKALEEANRKRESSSR